MGPIRYGIFIMPFHDQAKPLGQCYDEDMELVIRADELGFSEFLDRRAPHHGVREYRHA